ncbi:hypothetical protein KIW84_031934 [Lathyrus oleraceus]|uniref:Cytochrome P450 n=1 Tax=Pisum sativum TaxID=3888 RepID=A0A9D5B1A2_PEA|nr:hypothetical protein KIW84_031934 [Pisum sativum]
MFLLIQLQEYPEAAKFKDQGIRNLLEMEILFKDTLASGHGKWALSQVVVVLISKYDPLLDTASSCLTLLCSIHGCSITTRKQGFHPIHQRFAGFHASQHGLCTPGIFSEPRKHLAAWFPFGLGSRTCVGKNLALVEAKIALALIIQSYSFVVSPSYKHAPILFITLQPQHGAQIIFTRISA